MSLLQMSFSGAVLIAVIAGIRALMMNRLPKRTFLVLWGIVLLRLLFPFSVSSVFSVYSVVNRSEQIHNTIAETPMVHFIPETENIQFVPEAPMMQMTGEGEEVSLWFFLWLAGAVLCTVYFMVSYLRFYREFRFSLPVMNEFCAQWLRKHALRRKLSIRQSDRISTPLTYGIFRPVILMPMKTDWENKRQMSYVLLHEYVHICRFDTAKKLVLITALCIHWFNPFVWCMYILFNRDLELACDEQVVHRSGTGSRKEYALTLIHMAETRGSVAPLCSNFSKNAVEERICAVMKTKKRSVIAVLSAVLLIAAVSIVFATSSKKEEKEEKEEKGNSVYLENVRVGEFEGDPKPVVYDDSAEREIQNTADVFFEAYICQDKEGMKAYLADSYDGEVEPFQGNAEAVSDITVKEPNIRADVCTVSVEFRENGEDSFQYLSMELVKENDKWNVQFYGLER